MKIAKWKWGVLALVVGTMPAILFGCGNNQPAPPVVAKAPPPLTAAEKKFVATAISLAPQQQGDFFVKNIEMTRKPHVMAEVREKAKKVSIAETRGQKPRVPTGRPDF